MLDTWCFSTFRLTMPHMCSTWFRSGDIFGQQVHILESSFWREGIIFCFRMSQYMLESMYPLMNHSSPVPAMFPLMNHSSPVQQYSCSPRPWCYHHHAWLKARHNCLGTPHQGVNTHAGVKQVDLRLIRPQDMVPVIHALGKVVFSKLFAGFFVSQLQKRLPSGTTFFLRWETFYFITCYENNVE